MFIYFWPKPQLYKKFHNWIDTNFPNLLCHLSQLFKTEKITNCFKGILCKIKCDLIKNWTPLFHSSQQKHYLTSAPKMASGSTEAIHHSTQPNMLYSRYVFKCGFISECIFTLVLTQTKFVKSKSSTFLP